MDERDTFSRPCSLFPPKITPYKNISISPSRLLSQSRTTRQGKPSKPVHRNLNLLYSTPSRNNINLPSSPRPNLLHLCKLRPSSPPSTWNWTLPSLNQAWSRSLPCLKQHASTSSLCQTEFLCTPKAYHHPYHAFGYNTKPECLPCHPLARITTTNLPYA